MCTVDIINFIANIIGRTVDNWRPYLVSARLCYDQSC